MEREEGKRLEALEREWNDAEAIVREKFAELIQAASILSDAQRRVDLLEAYYINQWAKQGKGEGVPRNDAERQARLTELCSTEHEELRIAKLAQHEARLQYELAIRWADRLKLIWEVLAR
jgi:hypothetical protein